MKTTKILFFIALILIWLLPGLMGRDLWMNEEPYTFDIVNHVVVSGDWVVPTLAGEPFVEKPPLYFVTAAVFSKIFTPLVEPQDAARLASGLYMLLILLFTGLTAKELFGEKHAEITLLLLLGCTGIQLTAHKMITDIALLAGFSIALYGLALSNRRFALSGFWIGTGVGIGFMSKGLLAPGIIGITALVLPLAFSNWRRKRYIFSLLISLGAVLPWLVVWPYALYRRSPDLFAEWLWIQNVGRFLGFWAEGSRHAVVGAPISLMRGIRQIHVERIAFPVIPLALWSLWCNRHSRRDHPAYQLPLIMAAVILIVLSISANARPLYAVPVLIPLSLIAAVGTKIIPDKIESTITKANIIFFGLVSTFLWVCWLFAVTGHPAFVALLLNKRGTDFSSSFNGIYFGLAFFCTIVGFFAVRNRTRLGLSAVMSWTIGVTVVWSLLMTLWLPTLNERQSYRRVFASLRESVPTRFNCVASQGLDESERALIDYYAEIPTRRIELYGASDCDLLLVESDGGPNDTLPGPSWQLLWERNKTIGNSNEIFRLFQKKGMQSTITVQGLQVVHRR